MAVLCCRATGGHEVEPRRRAVFIRPPLTTRSTALATPVHHALAPLHRRCRRVAAPWGPPPSPHRPCAGAVAEQRCRSDCTYMLLLSLPIGLGLCRFLLSPPIGLGLCRLLSPPFLFFRAHGSPRSGRDKGGEGNSMCTRDCTRGPLLLFFFFLIRDRVCVALPFVTASSSTPSKDEVVAEPFQATATTFVIKPP